MLNLVFVVLVVGSILLAAVTGRMDLLTRGALEAAKGAVDIAIGLVGAMALFLGLMKVAEDGGLMRILARATGPVVRRLFPGVPADHPAVSAMLFNIASNMLGLGNAATPFGIKAMRELDRLNPRPGTATDAMVLFLAINTSGLAILPSGIIAIRSAAGSQDPAGIFVTTWFASGCATVVGIATAFALARLRRFRVEPADATAAPTRSDAPPDTTPDGRAEEVEPSSGAGDPRRGDPPRAAVPVALLVVAGYLAALATYLFAPGALPGEAAVTLSERARDAASYWILPAVIGGLVLFGWSRGVRVYESVVEGAKEGFDVAIRILPFLVAILVAVGMFRAAGGVELLGAAMGGVLATIGLPIEALPVAILRPLSGSGALAMVVEILNQPGTGPDTYTGYLVSTLYGSTETTFYVLAVYFGAVGVKRTRHAMGACLAADAAGIAGAVLIVRLLFG